MPLASVVQVALVTMTPMIQIFVDEAGEPAMRQVLLRPVVYLDHWAIRHFSMNHAVRDRLIAALRATRGTLLLSVHNFGEFSGVNVQEHASAAEEFFDLALPNVFVADFGADPGFIHEKGTPTADGKRDNFILVEVARNWLDTGKPSFAGLVSDSTENRAIVARALNDLQESISNAVASVKADSTKVEAARSGKRVPGARFRDLVQDALLQDFVITPEAQFGAHDSSDFVHALGSVMAADLILLDGRWAHIVNQADKRLKKLGVSHRLPRAFQQRGIPQFLKELEAYPPAREGPHAIAIPE